MRPAHRLGCCLCLLGAASSCRQGRDAPPAARVALATPSASGSWRPESNERDRVLLDGSTKSVAKLAGDERPRVYARALRAWIHVRPNRSAEHLGLLRAGGSLPASRESVGTDGCPGGWRAVEPRGFVCLGPTATLDASDPVVRLVAPFPPDFTRKLPYVYGTVRNPGPV